MKGPTGALVSIEDRWETDEPDQRTGGPGRSPDGSGRLTAVESSRIDVGVGTEGKGLTVVEGERLLNKKRFRRLPVDGDGSGGIVQPRPLMTGVRSL
jgi:hypothetical protein